MFDINQFQFTFLMAACQFTGFLALAVYLRADAVRALRTVSNPALSPVGARSVDSAPTLEEPRRAA